MSNLKLLSCVKCDRQTWAYQRDVDVICNQCDADPKWLERLKADLEAARAENRKLKGLNGKTKRQAATVRHPGAYQCETYTINAAVTPKQSIVLNGTRPSYDVRTSERRQVIVEFEDRYTIGGRAIYSGYNFCYFGTITSIGPKTVTITEDHGRNPTGHRLTVERFAFWNRQDVRFPQDERANWSD